MDTENYRVSGQKAVSGNLQEPACWLLQVLRCRIRESPSPALQKINLKLAKHHTACVTAEDGARRRHHADLKGQSRLIGHKLNGVALQFIDVQHSCHRKVVLA